MENYGKFGMLVTLLMMLSEIWWVGDVMWCQIVQEIAMPELPRNNLPGSALCALMPPGPYSLTATHRNSQHVLSTLRTLQLDELKIGLSPRANVAAMRFLPSFNQARGKDCILNESFWCTSPQINWSLTMSHMKHTAMFSKVSSSLAISRMRLRALGVCTAATTPSDVEMVREMNGTDIKRHKVFKEPALHCIMKYRGTSLT